MQNSSHNWRQALDSLKQYASHCARERARCAHRRQLQRTLAQTRKRLRQTDCPSLQKQYLTDLDSLRQRLEESESERQTARRQIRALQDSLAHASSAHSAAWNWPAMAASAFLVAGALASATSYQDSQDPWRSGVAATSIQISVVETADVPEAVIPAASNSVTQAARKTVRKAAPRPAKPMSHRQWGPPLLMASAQTLRATAADGFDPLVKQLQTDLLDLGFDLGHAGADGIRGRLTDQALDEFQSLYVAPEAQLRTLDSAGLATLVNVYAQLAREDADRLGIDRGVLAAIRLGSVRTGVEFSYLMELAAAESNFNPVAQVPGSSATGLYQFTRDTWLDTVRAHGEKYGLGNHAAQIDYVVYRGGSRKPVVRDADVLQHLLDLRRNPRVAALMAAESVKDHSAMLAGALGRKPARTELYLTHFLGADDAVSFLEGLQKNPGTFAADMFPVAAQNNHSIFHPQTPQPRTLNQVYEMFSRKFDTARYDALDLN
ncbi:MAG: transglycosylase SLT domain-containing protein [Thiogranum sp.]|nr:transglycosylase SLT domain-containing protein [Thiogranum sp.]